MIMSSEDEPIVENLLHPKKRMKNEKEWKRNRAKRMRHSGNGKHPAKACQHAGPHSYCQQEKLTPEDIRGAFNDFYVNSNKLRQDQYITLCLFLEPVQRRRVNENQRRRNVQYNIHYYITNQDGASIEVCGKTFLSVLCISPGRVKLLAKHKWSTNKPRLERRGGHRINPEYKDLKDQIKAHITRFICVSPHYGPGKTPHKKYLPSHLNVQKMFNLFKEIYDGPINVKYQYYYNIFVTCFDLKFENPDKDEGSN